MDRRSNELHYFIHSLVMSFFVFLETFDDCAEDALKETVVALRFTSPNWPQGCQSTGKLEMTEDTVFVTRLEAW